jgi:hypothetical protein
MTATELTAARTYWHVSRSPENAFKIYPTSYTPQVVGIVWEMMAQFQTWFGKAPYLMYGIQQLPITPVSEQRDEVDWAKEAYPEFSDSCESQVGCTDSGWSVLQQTMLATVGHPKLALERVMAMPSGNFDGAAGDGHSLSNTIWYIATRPAVAYPLQLPSAGRNSSDENHGSPSAPNDYVLTDCNQPASCTDFVLDTIAGLYSCRQRMQWLITQRGKTQLEACASVAEVEHSEECGLCNPRVNASNSGDAMDAQSCPPCTSEQCESDLNRCPRYRRTFVCTEGRNVGGCAGAPWNLASDQCSDCCELTACLAFEATQAARQPPVLDTNDDTHNCPACEAAVYESRINQCPKDGTAPFLCYDGLSAGGCSTRPWITESRQCRKCCRVPHEG